jgi:hypothetical protein
MSLQGTTANTGERAGALLVLAKLTNLFEWLTTILADQEFYGVDFIAKVKTSFV